MEVETAFDVCRRPVNITFNEVRTGSLFKDQSNEILLKTDDNYAWRLRDRGYYHYNIDEVVRCVKLEIKEID